MANGIAYWRGRHILLESLGYLPRRVEQVGSTGVPGLPAKPIVDILVGVDDPDNEGDYLGAMETTGYELRVGEAGHRMFRTPERDVHVQVWKAGSDEERRHLLLRDWLRQAPDDRVLYESVKRRFVGERSIPGPGKAYRNGTRRVPPVPTVFLAPQVEGTPSVAFPGRGAAVRLRYHHDRPRSARPPLRRRQLVATAIFGGRPKPARLSRRQNRAHQRSLRAVEAAITRVDTWLAKALPAGWLTRSGDRSRSGVPLSWLSTLPAPYPSATCFGSEALQAASSWSNRRLGLVSHLTFEDACTSVGDGDFCSDT